MKSLSPKEKRYLPWLIYLNKDPKIIDNISFLKAILSYLNPTKTYYLNALIYVYIKNFSLSPGNELIRNVIFENLKRYTGHNRRLIKWKNKLNYLFTKNAVSKCAQIILAKTHDSIDKSLDFLGLTGDLANSNFLKFVAYDTLKLTENNLALIPIFLDLLKSPQNPFEPRFPELIPQVASQLIPKVNDYAKNFKELLSKFFVKYIGDPRLPGNRVRWSKVSNKAREIFIKWLAEKDIEFFFEVIAKTAYDKHWRYRRKFWEAYLPHIESTWIILGTKARTLIEDNYECKYEYKYGILRGGSSDQSIIFLKIKNYIFVEWSHSGACRVCTFDQFFYEFRDEYRDLYLRNINYIYRQVHYGSESYKWQEELADWIRSNLEIYPTKSYYLD